MILVRRRLPVFSFSQAVEVVFLGVFGNVSTLSVGSVPMQSYYLQRCGLMAGRGIGTMTLEYVFHKSSVLLYTTAMLLLQGCWLSESGGRFTGYLWLGYGICAVIIVVLLLLCSWEKVQWLAAWLIDRLPHTEKWEGRKQLWKANLAALYTESRQLLCDRLCILKVLGLTGLKLCCLYCIPFLAMRMLGLSGLSFWQVQMLTTLMHLISNALPNVAGMGSIETAFLLVFGSFLERGEVMSVMMLYRIASYYVVFAASAVGFFIAQRHLGQMESEPPKEA